MRSDPRRAGAVLRYHTWPMIVRQTNAEHAWNVMRIITTIWPNTPASVLRYCMHHDSGELGSGDVPFPVKAQNPILRAEMERIEAESLREQGIDLPALTPEWKWKVKICDLIEMMEKGMEESNMGNLHGDQIIAAVSEAIHTRLLEWHEQYDVEEVREYLVWRQRIDDAT